MLSAADALQDAEQSEARWQAFEKELKLRRLLVELPEIKVIKCRDIDYETARKEVAVYFKRKGEAYPDEAAEDLELDFDLVMKITAKLRRDGTLEEA